MNADLANKISIMLIISGNLQNGLQFGANRDHFHAFASMYSNSGGRRTIMRTHAGEGGWPVPRPSVDHLRV